MNQINEFKLQRSGIIITLRCTLKCKLCAAYSPYYEIPPHYSYELVSKTIDKFFSVVDYVDQFDFTGGEPLLHNELPKMIKKLMEYSDRFRRVEIITSGTLMPNEELKNVLFQYKEKCHIMVDHYGKLSPKADQLKEFLERNKISYRMNKYFGDDAYFGGWVDFGDFSQKLFNQSDIEKLRKKCAVNCFVIRNGQMHTCSRSYRCMELNLIQDNTAEYIDFFDESLTIDDQRVKIINLINMKSLTACAYCNGLCLDSPRVKPAEQIR